VADISSFAAIEVLIGLSFVDAAPPATAS